MSRQPNSMILPKPVPEMSRDEVFDIYIQLMSDRKGKIAAAKLNAGRFWFERRNIPELYDRYIQETSFMDNHGMEYTPMERLVFLEEGYKDYIPLCPMCGKGVCITGRRVGYFCSQKCSWDYRKTDEYRKSVSDHKLGYSEEKKSRIQAQRNATMIEKYGYTYNMERPEVWVKLDEINKERTPESARPYLWNKDALNELYNIQKLSGSEIGKIIGCDYSTVLDYCRKYGWKIRKIYHESMGEKELRTYLRGELGDDIVCPEAVRDIPGMGRKEFDIWIPSLNHAIEYDGYHWHNNISENTKKIHKDSEKDSLADAAGIILSRVPEYFWKEDQEFTKYVVIEHIKQNKKVNFSITNIESPHEDFLLNNPLTITDNKIILDYCIRNNIPLIRYTKLSKDYYIKVITQYLESVNITNYITKCVYNAVNIDILIDNKIAVFVNMLKDCIENINHTNNKPDLPDHIVRYNIYEPYILDIKLWETIKEDLRRICDGCESTIQYPNKLYYNLMDCKLVDENADAISKWGRAQYVYNQFHHYDMLKYSKNGQIIKMDTC